MNISYTVLLITATISASAQKANYEKLTNEGLQSLIQKDIDSAIVKYNMAYKIDSSRVEANYGLGVAYLYRCQLKSISCKECLYFLDKSIHIDDSYRNGYFNRGKCKGSLKDYKGALTDFDDAIERNPNDSDYYFNRGLIKIKLSDHDGACKDFKRSAELGYQLANEILRLNCFRKH